MQQNVGIKSSSSYLPSLELVWREDQWFFQVLTVHTKVDLQVAQCAHGVCALQSSSYDYIYVFMHVCVDTNIKGSAKAQETSYSRNITVS